jgi:NodT family efflux transporter outer membrane factor (OMF) lipoprotein
VINIFFLKPVLSIFYQTIQVIRPANKFTASFILFCLAGCSSGPRAKPISLPNGALQASVEKANEDPLIVLTDSFPDEWWVLFQDDQLSSFIETAFANNPTLQDAEARILEAAYQAALTRARLYPNLLLSADISRQKLSETGLAFPMQNGAGGGVSPPLPPGGVAGIPVYFTQYETEFNLTYEFDFWKKNRNSLKAALGVMYADMADAAFSRLQLGISLAQVYFQLQIDYKRREIANQEVQNRRSYIDVVQERIKWNVDNDTDLTLAKYKLGQSEKVLLQIEADVVIKENQLKAYLAGDFEEDIQNINIADQPLPIVPLPINLPLHLISRRPDIASQLWLIYSAGRQIEVAKAGFYPDFNLTAFFGFQTLHLHELFLGKSANYNIDPAVSLPIFDGGRLKANLYQSEVDYDRAIFQYNSLVLNAAREVLDGIAILRNSEQQLRQTVQLLEYQEKLSKLTQIRVNGHLRSTLDNLSSESDQLTAADQKIVALGDTLQSVLLLIKALGGGYEACSASLHPLNPETEIEECQ